LVPWIVIAKPFGYPASASSFFAPSGSYFGGFNLRLVPKNESARSCPAGIARFSMIRSAIASRLIAMESAFLTRASLNGFFASGFPSLSVTKGALSAFHWFRCT
jgi:hypothetical protein